MKNRILSSLTCLFVLSVSVYAQQSATDTLGKYNAAERKCVALTDKETWKAAEISCKKALAVANQLSEQKTSEKMRAFENYGFVLFSQEKYQAALDHFTRAYEIGKTFLSESDSDLAYAYLNLGRANQGFAKLDEAQENYRKAEGIYRLAFDRATNAELKTKHKSSIRRTLVLQIFVAEYLNDKSLIEEIERKITELEKPAVN